MDGLDKVLKWLGVGWSVLALIFGAAFFFGGEWQDWQNVKRVVLNDSEGLASAVEVADLAGKLESLGERVKGIHLVASEAEPSQPYGCGQTQRSEATSLVVMSGLRDGTSCEISNQNFYKKLELVVPK